MKLHYKLLFLALLYLQTGTSQIVSIELLESYTQPQLSVVLTGFVAENGVDIYKVVYNTTDPQGNATIASGAMYVPNDCNNFALLAYQHGTVFDREAVPSRFQEPIGLFFAAYGFAAVATDYLGLGDGPGLHPYLHAETQATAAIDLMRAARTYVSDTLGLNFNGEVFLTGYSQGGHAAMALHKYIEDNNLLTEFDIKGSAPLSGPYNLSGVQMTLPSDSIYANPEYLPYLIESYQSVYGNLYNHPSEYYKAPYDSLIALYFNGTNDPSQIVGLLPNNIFHFMEDTMLNAFIADTVNFSHPFRLALAQNDNYDWLPTRPIRMCYCSGDEQVFFQNSIVAESTMLGNGATDVQAVHVLPGADHSGCVFPALFYTLSWFNSLKTSCQAVATTSVDISNLVKVFPNPVSETLFLDFTNVENFTPMVLNLFDLNGRLIASKNIQQPTFQWNLNYLPKGMYILRGTGEQTQISKKIIVQ